MSAIKHVVFQSQQSDSDSGYGSLPVMYMGLFEAPAAGILKFDKLELNLEQKPETTVNGDPITEPADQMLVYVLYKETDPEAEYLFPSLNGGPMLSNTQGVICHGILGPKSGVSRVIQFHPSDSMIQMAQGDQIYLVGTLTRDRMEHVCKLRAILDVDFTQV